MTGGGRGVRHDADLRHREPRRNAEEADVQAVGQSRQARALEHCRERTVNVVVVSAGERAERDRVADAVGRRSDQSRAGGHPPGRRPDSRCRVESRRRRSQSR